jgi:hypothetical protein
MTRANGTSNDDEDDDEPNTDPDLVWSTPTWSDAAEGTAPGGVHTTAARPPPPPYPPIQPKKDTSRNTRLAILLAAVAAVLLCGCVTAVVVTAAFGRTIIDNVRERNRETGRLNEPVRDGPLEFRVSRVDCGVPDLGDSFAYQAAVGQFCLVEMNVRNVSDEPATFSDEHQRAYGEHDEEFAADSGAGVLANAQQQIFLNKINPGNQVTGIVVYDIPPDASIVKIELRASERSTGALVTTR